MKVKVLATSIVAAGLLIGCGGSSSSDSSTGTEVQGTAVDEIMQNAKVTLRAGSPNGKILAETATDENGNYSAKVSGYNGVVVTVVECNDSTTLKDFDGTDLGKCNLNVPLMSAVTVGQDPQVDAHVSPLTTQMVALATKNDSSAEIDTTKLLEAKKVIAYMYGIDPVTSDPIDDTNYQKEVKVLHTVAENNNIDLSTLITDLNKDVEDGSIGDDSEYVDDIKTQLQTDGVSSAFVESSSDTIDVEDTVQDTTPYDAIATAKATFTTIRGQINSLTNTNGTGTLDTEKDAIINSLNKNTFDIVGYNVEALAKLIDIIAKSSPVTSGSIVLDNGNVFEYEVSTNDNKTWNYTLKDSNNKEYKGSIASSLDTTTLDSLNIDEVNAVTLKVDGELPTKTLDVSNIKTDIALSKTSSTLTLNLNNLYIGTSSDNFSINNVSVTVGYNTNENDEPSLNYIKLNSIALDTTLDNRFVINGQILINYAYNDSLAKQSNNNIAYNNLWFIGTNVYCIDENDVAEKYTGTETPTYTINGNTYSMDKCEDGFCFSDDPDIGFPIDMNGEDFSINVSNLTCENGDPKVVNEEIEYGTELTNGGYIPTAITFTGKLKDITTNFEVDGSISIKSDDLAQYDFSSSENGVVIGTVEFGVLLKREEFEDTKLNMTFKTIDREGSVDISMSYQEGTEDLITLVANYKKTDNQLESGKVAITAINGFKVDIPVNANGDIDYSQEIPVYVNSEKVGDVEERDGVPVIKYSDGTFESFN